MSKRDWRLFVYDMLDSIGKIESYLSDMSYEEFLDDDKTKDAVVRNLEIIGEAANRIPEKVKEKHQEIPWRQIVGLRNRLIHGYFVVDYRIVWNIATKELSRLKFQLKKMLR